MDEQQNEQNGEAPKERDTQTFTKSRPFDNYTPSESFKPDELKEGEPASEPPKSEVVGAPEAEAKPTGGWSADAIDSTPVQEVTKPESSASIYPFPGQAAVTSVPAPSGQSPAHNTQIAVPEDDRPIPVVKVLSVRGVEYAMMSILLWIGAGSLIVLLVSIINGGGSFDALAFPISLLLVCVPGFAWFYLRLRKAELDNPSLRLEPSKRRFSQITQILAFLTCFSNIVVVVYTLVSMAGGNEVGSVGKILGASFVTLLIAGGILAYYWFDEHKLARG